MDAKDEQYHLRCLDLAKQGLGHVSPNPLVGAVLVVDDKIIGEGYHSFFGGPHAEVNAINSVKDKSLLQKATLYVNLEPCSHFGKTPPCADLIIENKIPRVVIGLRDPFEQVSGRGIEKLKSAGVDVIVLENDEENRFLNRRFLTFHEKKRPYIILKWAETSDGFIDKIRKRGEKAGINWITDKTTKVLVHKWRTEEQAILIGTNTVLNDNPQLNAREWPGNNPIRLIPDLSLRLPEQFHIFDGTVPTYVFTRKTAENKLNVSYINIGDKELTQAIIEFCCERHIISLFIEGGSQLLTTFLNKDLWNEARVFTGLTSFQKGVKAPVRPAELSKVEQIGNSDLYIYYNQHV